MATTVFVTGAGASKEAGVPLMADFLEVADHLWRREGSIDARQHFEAVFNAIGALQLVYSKAQLNLNNIETVFSAFETASFLGILPGSPSAQLEQLIGSLKTVIVRTIESTMLFQFRNHRIHASESYASFARLISQLINDANPAQQVSIITFNYDIGLDFALHQNGIPFTYGMNGQRDPHQVSLLKLHGSLNWAYCPTCKQVIPWDLANYFRTHSINPITEPTTIAVPIGSQLHEFKHEHDIEKTSVIVPPTINKRDYQYDLQNVWRLAAKELAEAENIFVLGYSLPETDLFFSYLYALATVGTKLIRRFWVFNPDDSGAVEARFRKILGGGALARFAYHPTIFGASFNDIYNEFKYKRHT